jgi:hydroxyacylglutathione hydrolase
MLIRSLYFEGLAHATHVFASERTLEAVVVDPPRGVEPVLQALNAMGVRARQVIDTHWHTELLSGATELAARTGAEVRPFSAGEPCALELGELHVEVVATPGHAPEHRALALYDAPAAGPAVLLSGGAMLAGELPMPFLLDPPVERWRDRTAATLRALQDLPGHVQVLPTHVRIGHRLLTTTIGYEALTTPLRTVLSEAPVQAADWPVPALCQHWSRLREANRCGVEPLGTVIQPPPCTIERFLAERRDDDVVIDVREPEAFAGGHVPRSLNIGLGVSFGMWCGSLVPAGSRIWLVQDKRHELWDVVWHLLRLGLPVPLGFVNMFDWRSSGQPVGRLPTLTVEELDAVVRAGRAGRIVDVRQPAEWAAGHIQGTRHLPAAEVPARLPEGPDEPLVVICSSGYRSSAVASYLLRAGFWAVSTVWGGVPAWRAAGHPLVGPEATA